MANFNEAFDITMKHEGYYSNDPDDLGGETYRGISRRYNPQWEGWNILDKLKSKYKADHKELEPHVRKFYQDRYWYVNRLDEFPQSIANKIFDIGVNMGVNRAAQFLQRSLNYLNLNGALFNDLIDDGIIGRKTLSALYAIIKRGDELTLLKIINIHQGQHYLDYMKRSPLQEKYARGWFSRISI